MSTSSLFQQYLNVMSSNVHYNDYKSRWNFYLQSYMGGDEYRTAGHLTRYVNETQKEYDARLIATPLDNHCRSVISVYTSFLFRENPERNKGSLEYDPTVEEFCKDADMDGRSLDNFMKEVAVWASVFGHAWIIVSKPNIGAVTMADEQSAGVRPYVNILTPLNVLDWRWKRSLTGAYSLDYIKYIEDSNDTMITVKEWTPEVINTYVVDNVRKELVEELVEPNGLGKIPAVITYSSRSPIRGIGASALSDIADHQRKIYNELSEVEQSIRLNGHPALVKTPDVEASAGAGAIVSMPDNLDPGLKPYMLSVSTDIGAIYASIKESVAAIDKMANTGAIRTNEVREISGIAMRTEFELLNAKLAEMADNLELAEEQMWKLYAEYQGKQWDGAIEYPGSFNIQDVEADVNKLKTIKDAATDPRVLQLVDHELIELLGEDADVIMPEGLIVDTAQLPDQPVFEPHVMIDVETGEEYIASTEQEHLALAAKGYVHKKDY